MLNNFLKYILCKILIIICSSTLILYTIGLYILSNHSYSNLKSTCGYLPLQLWTIVNGGILGLVCLAVWCKKDNLNNPFRGYAEFILCSITLIAVSYATLINSFYYGTIVVDNNETTCSEHFKQTLGKELFFWYYVNIIGLINMIIFGLCSISACFYVAYYYSKNNPYEELEDNIV